MGAGARTGAADTEQPERGRVRDDVAADGYSVACNGKKRRL